MDSLPLDMLTLLNTYMHPAAMRSLSTGLKRVADRMPWTRAWLQWDPKTDPGSEPISDPVAPADRAALADRAIAYCICATGNLNYIHSENPTVVLEVALVKNVPDVAREYIRRGGDIYGPAAEEYVAIRININEHIVGTETRARVHSPQKSTYSSDNEGLRIYVNYEVPHIWSLLYLAILRLSDAECLELCTRGYNIMNAIQIEYTTKLAVAVKKNMTAKFLIDSAPPTGRDFHDICLIATEFNNFEILPELLKNTTVRRVHYSGGVYEYNPVL